MVATAYLLKKEDAAANVKYFCEFTKNYTVLYPSNFRCDRGGEFVSNDMKTYFHSRGIKLDLACANAH